MSSDHRVLIATFQEYASAVLARFKGVPHTWAPRPDRCSAWLFIGGSGENGFDMVVTVLGGTVVIDAMGVSLFLDADDHDAVSRKAAGLVEEMLTGSIRVQFSAVAGGIENRVLFRTSDEPIRTISRPARNRSAESCRIFANTYRSDPAE